MKEREKTLDTLRLVIAILRRIPRVGSITANSLQEQLAAEGLERDVRTIQRQLEALSADPDLGIERDDRSKPYGYRWLKNAKGFSVTSLSPQEAMLFRMAEQQLKSMLPANLMKSMDGFFAQAHRQLADMPPTQREREWLEKVRVVSTTQPLLAPKIDPGVFEQVSNALYSNLWLVVNYQSGSDKQTQARVMPLGMVQQGPRMYLVCRFDGYDNERCLALHRFRSAEASTLEFDRPSEFNLQQFDDAGHFNWGTGKPIQLMFWASKGLGDNLIETPLAKDQVLEDMKGGYRVCASVVDSMLLRHWLRGHGKNVRVLEPAGLVN